MGYKKYCAAIAAAGMIGAMSLGSVFTSYAADGWSKSNDSWTYIYNGQTHTGWLQTSELVLHGFIHGTYVYGF
mgnify:CR=1 FL=1